LRGINSEKKWVALASKIEESNCDIICLQKTKRESFDLEYIKKFCPRKFNKFEYLPSVGASGGIIIIWCSSLFTGTLAFQNEFSISVQFTCNISASTWIFTNIYGPSQADRKQILLNGSPTLICLLTWIG
jgi:exonuclease III